MNRILVALDGSPRATQVLDAATATARAHGGKILLLRAVAIPTDLPQDSWKATDMPLLDVLRRHCEAYIEEQSEGLPKELVESIEVRIGVPWEAICAAARDTRADLIVIGSHGYSTLDRVLGTTAAKVVNHAPCSVLVVRGPTATPPAH